MKTLLFTLQIITGLSTLGLLALIIVKAYHGHSSRRLTGWIFGLTGAFVVLSLLLLFFT